MSSSESDELADILAYSGSEYDPSSSGEDSDISSSDDEKNDSDDKNRGNKKRKRGRNSDKKRTKNTNSMRAKLLRLNRFNQGGTIKRNLRNLNKGQPTTPPNRTTTGKIVQKPFSAFMRGVIFTMSGFVNPLRSELRSKAVEMGAQYKPDWDSSCTHLICAFPKTPKYNQVKGVAKIVKKEWIENSYHSRKCFPWRRYALDWRDSNKSESEDEVHELLANNDGPSSTNQASSSSTRVSSTDYMDQPDTPSVSYINSTVEDQSVVTQISDEESALNKEVEGRVDDIVSSSEVYPDSSSQNSFDKQENHTSEERTPQIISSSEMNCDIPDSGPT